MRKRELQDSLVERDGLVCGICHDSIADEWERLLSWRKDQKSYKRSSINLDIDHKMPFSVVGGERWGDIDNLQLVHKYPCNNAKANMLQ